jgi:rubredoxin
VTHVTTLRCYLVYDLSSGRPRRPRRPGVHVHTAEVPLSLTKCPHCEHTVLSVAAQCPACGGILGSTFLGLEHEGELTECRSCGHPVRTRTRVCPHCGIEKPALRPRVARGLAIGIAAVALAVAAVVARQWWMGLPAPTAPPPASRPATTPPVPVSPPPTASPQVPPSGSEAPPRVESAPPGAAAAAPTPDSVAARLQTRWTADWSNVRQAPSNGAPVIRVLPPGAEVRGTRGDWGWWRVQLSADTVGYVAGSLLVPDRPPGNQP